jgi:hypothetical protein
MRLRIYSPAAMIAKMGMGINLGYYGVTCRM